MNNKTDRQPNSFINCFSDVMKNNKLHIFKQNNPTSLHPQISKLADMTTGERNFVKLLQDNNIYYHKPRKNTHTYYVGKPFRHEFVFDVNDPYVCVKYLDFIQDNTLKLAIPSIKKAFCFYFENTLDIVSKCVKFNMITEIGFSKLKFDKKPLSPIAPHEKYSKELRAKFPVVTPIKTIVHSKVWY